jgi:hypothetical protein
MNKNKQIIVAVAFPILLASLFILIDYVWFSPAISQNESGISWGLGLYEKPFSLFSKNPFFDLGGATFVSEIMRHLALFLILTSVLLPMFLKYMEEPIERTELNLTNKLI